jgi:hypothetical protein
MPWSGHRALPCHLTDDDGAAMDPGRGTALLQAVLSAMPPALVHDCTQGSQTTDKFCARVPALSTRPRPRPHHYVAAVTVEVQDYWRVQRLHACVHAAYLRLTAHLSVVKNGATSTEPAQIILPEHHDQEHHCACIGAFSLVVPRTNRARLVES